MSWTFLKFNFNSNIQKSQTTWSEIICYWNESFQIRYNTLPALSKHFYSKWKFFNPQSTRKNESSKFKFKIFSTQKTEKLLKLYFDSRYNFNYNFPNYSFPILKIHFTACLLLVKSYSKCSWFTEMNPLKFNTISFRLFYISEDTVKLFY